MSSVGMPAVEWSRHSSVLSFTNPIAVESHGDSAVGIACMDKVLREVKIVFEQFREGVVGSLVGKVGTPICECFQLVFSDIVGKDRGIMTLYYQLEAVAAASDMGLHSVPYQYILKLRTEVKATWVSILSY